MSDKPTKKLKTPNGKDVEIREYLTARERNEFRAVFIKHSTFKVEEGSAQIDHIEGAANDEAEAKIIELAAVSYDGSPEKILERLLDGDPQDYDFVVTEAVKVVKGNFQTAK